MRQARARLTRGSPGVGGEVVVQSGVEGEREGEREGELGADFTLLVLPRPSTSDSMALFRTRHQTCSSLPSFLLTTVHRLHFSTASSESVVGCR